MITRFLTDLDAVLTGPARARRRLLRDAADGLTDTVAAYQAAGLDEATAARRALADFGDVVELAPAYQAELDIAAARHTARTVLLPIPPLAALWNLAWDFGPDHHRHPLAAITVTITAGAIAAAAFLAVLAILATTGRPSGRRPIHPTWMRTCARTHAAAVTLALAMVPVMSPIMVAWPPTIVLVLLTATAIITIARTSGVHRQPGGMRRRAAG